MTRPLDGVFAELGLTHYLGAFVDQGFDTWDTILDIQESDLDALGVKLGHRRKLQRRIANARGVAPGTSLVSPKPTSEDSKQDGTRPEPPRSEPQTEGNGVLKRKYRRHPKSDENAPERPPSAYVLFSNKMREDLKSQSLTFTEIAKLVGENWQNLAPAEKESYETQANTAKDKYHRDLVEYKKTGEYRRYAQYLHDFKEKQAKQSQAHEVAKRPKLDSGRGRNGSSSSSATPNSAHSSGSISGSGSSSERLQGSEPPPTRHERVNSIVSMTDPSAAPTPMSQGYPASDAGLSPRVAQFDVSSSREPVRHSRRQNSWRESGRNVESGRHNLPSLSDMLDDGKMGMSVSSVSSTSEGNPYATGFATSNWRQAMDGPPTLPPARPHLRHEPSPNGSHGSGSSATSYSRTTGESSLPIHALLSNNSAETADSKLFERSTQIPITSVANPVTQRSRTFMPAHGPSGYGFQAASSAFQHMKVEENGDGDVLMTQGDPVPARPAGKSGLDGMSALLRAGEIVDRRRGE